MEGIQRAASAARLNNIVLVKGDIRDTLPDVCKSISFGLAHIDLDIYDPIRFAQRELLEHLIPGGYLVYDDALVSSCPGAMMAVEDLIRSGKSSEQFYPHFVFRA
jgi:SAM-dependent methyltransferase